MAKKKRQAVDNAYNAIIGGDVRAGKGKEPNPLGVKLTAEEKEWLASQTDVDDA